MKVITLGEIMLRLCPVERERFVQADRFTAVYGGGEANVAVSLATLGEESVFVSKVPNNELGQAAVNSLRRYGVDTRRIVRGEGRLGIYFLERGASQRPDKVLYDRANSAFSLSDEHEYVFRGCIRGRSVDRLPLLVHSLRAKDGCSCDEGSEKHCDAFRGFHCFPPVG